MSYFVGMSPVEMQFIRVYVSALKRHYPVIRSVVDLMNPDGLGIQDFYKATTTAVALADMHDDFEQGLQSAKTNNKMRIRKVTESPTEDELADLFGLSFFKLITTAPADDNKKFSPQKLHEGWFSGKPDEWKNTLKAYKDAPTGKDNALTELLTECFNAFAKLFHKHDMFPHGFKPGFGKKLWPAESDFLDDQGDDAADDFDGDPFDWLFGDPDDDD
jgi:hypothetical protein